MARHGAQHRSSSTSAGSAIITATRRGASAVRVAIVSRGASCRTMVVRNSQRSRSMHHLNLPRSTRCLVGGSRRGLGGAATRSGLAAAAAIASALRTAAIAATLAAIAAAIVAAAVRAAAVDARRRVVAGAPPRRRAGAARGGCRRRRFAPPHTRREGAKRRREEAAQGQRAACRRRGGRVDRGGWLGVVEREGLQLRQRVVAVATTYARAAAGCSPHLFGAGTARRGMALHVST